MAEVVKEEGVQPCLVKVVHDESIFTAHNGVTKSWGAGRGIHCSKFLCSTLGWLREAGQTIEYGKNHDGYWTGEQLCEQIWTHTIPAFEAAHPGQQALFIFDNSSGHCAYALDALLAQSINLNAGGKQPVMRPGWYMEGAQCILQPMAVNGVPQGAKAILMERGLWRLGMYLDCRKRERNGVRLQHGDEGGLSPETQPDFQEQTPYIQELVESVGHLCLFLPKFHCELNFIEYFWGAVKAYTQRECDYTFEGLKRAVPAGMAAVKLETIQKWEHCTVRGMKAYEAGNDPQVAQKLIQQYSSTCYTSHRCIPEAVAAQLDG
ncbi:hypothetical protein CALCODRAFT_539190 [Calocera cornea HHB12733]|uniref:Tc1-like transposase DDE domain-containing protein n=1 Tax=Calocera cornea HHB12733 TaxID=1353952 RepID=A0A165BZD4_9BASI|nr:hypothetical protein CALCODRAFT_539190 [Calocera cornea HHB12733]